MLKHFNITISGEVQGVNFRAETKKQADEMSISGFVENLSNDTVYIEAEGEEKKLDEFIRWCRKGTWFSKVKKAAVVESNPKGFKDFVIKY
jgi:acylphosphatase